ncbi:MAG: helicase C-terminal domain-containing protein [Granulosicoccaceae bacterium]
MTKTVKLSITELVRLACASGDLINTGPAGPTALQGQRAHKKLQENRPEQQQAEVKIEANFGFDGWDICLGGRVDLLDQSSTPPHLIEIKSCLAPPHKLPQSSHDQHWAQLYFYGYCHLLKHPKLSDIRLSLHWIEINQDKLTEESRELQRAELADFCEQALQRYLQLHALVQNHRQKALASAAKLEFPFDAFRPSQRNMSTAVYRCIRDRGRLISEAPTGIGKTISTLFPAIKAYGEGHSKRIFYLTAKNSGRQAADQAINQLRKSGLQICSVQLSAKQQLCHCSNGSCERTEEGHCPLTLGFFDRLPEAREELIQLRHIDTAALDAAAFKYQLCPFELSLQLIQWMDVVICDYNYVFDPLVRLTQVVENSKDISLLIDEAHNLVDRARSMYSADLSRVASLAAQKVAKPQPALAKSFASVGRAIKKATEDAESTVAEQLPPVALSRAVTKSLSAFNEALDGKPLSPELGEWFKSLYRYSVIDELFGEHHRALCSQHDKDRRVRLACLNATDKLQASFKNFHSVVCFSATLSPSRVYQTDLGLPQECLHQQLPSPFKPSQLGCFLCGDIDTRFAAREHSTPTLISIIEQVYRANPGNYLVFFPSYAYLDKTLASFTLAHGDIPVVAQGRTSDPEEREAFRQQFAQAGRLLGFAILGGVYSEGVDFVGDSLLGAIIVGTGLAAVSTEQKLIQNDYEQQGLDGFDYAFKYPGMTRVLQAAGRVIRSENDKGIVVLADRRFKQAFYRDLMPRLWHVQHIDNHRTLTNELNNFWI